MQIYAKPINSILPSCFSSLLVACSQTSVTRVDLTELRELYVVGYSSDAVIRNRMDDQLVADLMVQDIIATVSYEDIGAITRSTSQRLVNEALEKKVLGIIVIEQVAADGSDSSNQNPDRVSPAHPTLQEFYADSRELVGEAFAEVNLFPIDSSGGARLFWSGTTWSFNADNQGCAIRDISNTIAPQLSAAGDQFL